MLPRGIEWIGVGAIDKHALPPDDYWRPLVGVTLGDPAGVGPEVVAKAAAAEGVWAHARLVAIGPVAVIRPLAERVGVPVCVVADGALNSCRSGELPVLDVPGDLREVEVGKISPEAGRLALASVRLAVELALAGRVDAVATAPWNKEAIRGAGSETTGHTDLLAEMTGTPPDDVTMMLTHGDLRIFHVTTHVPLRRVFEFIEASRIRRVIELAHGVLRTLGIDSPRIAVAALNPHAGEGGLFGDEERLHLQPAIEEASRQGIDVVGPIPGDTVFWQAARGDFDGVVAMYHDQGHIPVKLAGRGHGVNVTVGLPIIRTAVDHGTAFDIAGEDLAEPTSMIEAIIFAADLARLGGVVNAARDTELSIGPPQRALRASSVTRSFKP